MKTIFTISCLSLAFILSPVKASDQDDDSYNNIVMKNHHLYRIVHIPPNETYYEFIDPYDLTTEEDAELDKVFENYRDGNCTITLKCAKAIRPELLQKMMLSHKWTLAKNILLSDGVRKILEQEITTMQDVLTSLKSPINAYIPNDLRAKAWQNPHLYTILEDTPEIFGCEFINPYNLTDEEGAEVEKIFITHGLVSSDQGNDSENVILTLACAKEIRSELLQKMMQGNQYSLEKDITLNATECAQLKAEIEIMKEALASKK